MGTLSQVVFFWGFYALAPLPLSWPACEIFRAGAFTRSVLHSRSCRTCCCGRSRDHSADRSSRVAELAARLGVHTSESARCDFCALLHGTAAARGGGLVCSTQ